VALAETSVSVVRVDGNWLLANVTRSARKGSLCPILVVKNVIIIAKLARVRMAFLSEIFVIMN